MIGRPAPQIMWFSRFVLQFVNLGQELHRLPFFWLGELPDLFFHGYAEIFVHLTIHPKPPEREHAISDHKHTINNPQGYRHLSLLKRDAIKP